MNKEEWKLNGEVRAPKKGERYINEDGEIVKATYDHGVVTGPIVVKNLERAVKNRTYYALRIRSNKVEVNNYIDKKGVDDQKDVDLGNYFLQFKDAQKIQELPEMEDLARKFCEILRKNQ